MTTADVIPIPVWKEGATAAEWLEEVASVARRHPEKFKRVAILHIESRPTIDVIHYYVHNLNTLEFHGLLASSSMLLDRDTVAYFKSMAAQLGMPYQSLINLYLRDCANHQRKLRMKWAT